MKIGLSAGSKNPNSAKEPAWRNDRRQSDPYGAYHHSEQPNVFSDKTAYGTTGSKSDRVIEENSR